MIERQQVPINPLRGTFRVGENGAKHGVYQSKFAAHCSPTVCATVSNNTSPVGDVATIGDVFRLRQTRGDRK